MVLLPPAFKGLLVGCFLTPKTLSSNRDEPPQGLILLTPFDVKNGVVDDERDYVHIKSKEAVNAVPIELTLVFIEELPPASLPPHPFNISITNGWFHPAFNSQVLRGKKRSFCFQLKEINPYTTYAGRERTILSWFFFSVFLLVMASSFTLILYQHLKGTSENHILYAIAVPLFLQSFGMILSYAFRRLREWEVKRKKGQKRSKDTRKKVKTKP